MVFFVSPWIAYQYIKTNKIKSAEEHDFAIECILYCNGQSGIFMDIIKNNLYRTNEQKAILIKRIIENSSKFSIEQLYSILDDDGIKQVIKNSLKDSHASLDFLNWSVVNNYEVNYDIIKKALQACFSNNVITIRLLCDQEKFKIDYTKKIEIIDKFSDDQIFIKKLFENNTKHFDNGDSDIRDYTFDIILNRFPHKMLLDMAKKGLLFSEELDKLYEKYGRKYFYMLKSKFNDFFNFCLIFRDFLDYETQQTLVKKVQNKTYKHRINEVLENYNLDDEFKDQLNAFKVAESMV